MTVWTVGHSNRALDDFLDLLRSAQIEAVADVRRFPGSRRHPHFNREPFAAALHDAGIEYVHIPGLGGRRSARSVSSASAGWRVEAFAAYADYMHTEEFSQAFGELSELAGKSRTAFMCAEALPWQCHRRLIADQFIARGWLVLDIVAAGQVKQHALPHFASIAEGRLTYPA